MSKVVLVVLNYFSSNLMYKTIFFNLLSDKPVELFDKAPVMVTGLDLNNPIMQFGGACARPPIAALAASTDKDAMCYSMFPSLSVDPTFAR